MSEDVKRNANRRSLKRRGSAFVCEQMPWEKEWVIRIVIPSIDEGSAVHLEATCKRATSEEAEALLDKIMERLRNVRRERPTNDKDHV